MTVSFFAAHAVKSGTTSFDASYRVEIAGIGRLEDKYNRD